MTTAVVLFIAIYIVYKFSFTLFNILDSKIANLTRSMASSVGKNLFASSLSLSSSLLGKTSKTLIKNPLSKGKDKLKKGFNKGVEKTGEKLSEGYDKAKDVSKEKIDDILMKFKPKMLRTKTLSENPDSDKTLELGSLLISLSNEIKKLGLSNENLIENIIKNIKNLEEDKLSELKKIDITEEIKNKDKNGMFINLINKFNNSIPKDKKVDISEIKNKKEKIQEKPAVNSSTQKIEQKIENVNEKIDTKVEDKKQIENNNTENKNVNTKNEVKYNNKKEEKNNNVKNVKVENKKEDIKIDNSKKEEKVLKTFGSGNDKKEEVGISAKIDKKLDHIKTLQQKTLKTKEKEKITPIALKMPINENEKKLNENLINKMVKGEQVNLNVSVINNIKKSYNKIGEKLGTNNPNFKQIKNVLNKLDILQNNISKEGKINKTELIKMLSVQNNKDLMTLIKNQGKR